MSSSGPRPMTTIRLSETEKRYARALSARKGCKLKAGSVGYAVKWLLNNYAKKEGLAIADEKYILRH
jgi:hypothetical protein